MKPLAIMAAVALALVCSRAEAEPANPQSPSGVQAEIAELERANYADQAYIEASALAAKDYRARAEERERDVAAYQAKIQARQIAIEALKQRIPQSGN